MSVASTQDAVRRLEASGAGKSAMDALRAKAGEVVADEASLLAARSATAAAASASRLANWVGLGAIGLASAVGLLLLHAGIARPIAGLTAMMGRLARGDVGLTVPGANRRDEVGAMAAAVGVFKDTMIRTRQLEADTELARAGAGAEAQRKAAMRAMADSFGAAVGGIVGQVSASAIQLQATARTMTTTAGETAGQSSAVASAEEAAANVDTVSAAAEELGASVQEIGRQVQGSASLAQAAMGEADETAQLVQALTRAVATRYDKDPDNFLASVKLAALRVWLRT